MFENATDNLTYFHQCLNNLRIESRDHCTSLSLNYQNVNIISALIQNPEIKLDTPKFENGMTTMVIRNV